MNQRRGTVRFRTTALATAVVTLAVAVGAVALVILTRRSLTDSAQARAEGRAQAIADLAAAGAATDPLPGSGDVFGQLLDSSGEVVAATRNVDVAGPMLVTDTAPGEQVVVTVGEIEDAEGNELGGRAFGGPFVVAVVGTEVDGAPVQAVATASLASVRRTTSILVPLLLIGVPLIGGLVALTSWRMVGRSFRPIEAMRAEAEGISLSDLDRRIPVPDSQDEIRRLADTLNTMLDRLEASVERQRRFVADASHELKSPIASLVTMADVAGARPEAVEVARLAADVGHEANRLALLVDDLLTLARSDEDRVALELAEIDLAEIVRQETVRLRTDILVNDEGVGSVPAPVDRRRIGQAVRNLLDNAVRHARSTVWVETLEEHGSAVVTVADDGPGIPPEHRERIFERFHRLDEARSRPEGGTGLGLAVVRAIVESHGGTVAVVDDPRFPGASFRIELPGR